jgi:TonB family protein
MLRSLVIVLGLSILPHALLAQVAVLTLDRPPQFVKVHARYHPQAQRSSSGRVDLQFVIDTSGRAERHSIRVIQVSDSAFIEAAILTVLAAEYHPGIARGHPVRVQVRQSITFKKDEMDCRVVITTLLEPQCADSTTRRWP